ncbi:uncharacterized protein RJT21DRAFT_122700 [Scheffersomyces amazonensis]|uniref:uncharacterized protein n=1 Tax=Scheffersomyces amazonensis TaxID=1078765 RepID=UPI00315D4995
MMSRSILSKNSIVPCGIRQFSQTVVSQSNIGKMPIKIPNEVKVSTEEIPLEFCKSFNRGKQTYVLDRQVVIRGPLGVIKTPIPQFLSINEKPAVDENVGTITVKIKDSKDKVQRSMWGTIRATLQNHTVGTTEGHLAIVKFVGTGYRAIIEEDPKDPSGKIVSLKLGLNYTPRLKVPKGLTVSSPSPARLVIEGINKQQVKLFAAVIREYKKPEPYKGKGIFVDHETIKLKEKKIK